MSGNFIDKYPYTDFHELNLDWILKKVKDTEQKVDDFTVFNTLTWAGNWDASKSYVKWSIVQDSDGNGYISVKPVPPNVPLSNGDYWQQIAKYEVLYAAFNTRIESLEKNAIKETENVLFVSFMDGSTDAEKLQNCIDYAENNNINTIFIDCDLDITGSTIKVNLPEGSNGQREQLNLIGVLHSTITKNDSGYMFSSDILSHALHISNLRFKSGSRKANVFDACSIIRIQTFHNYYDNVNYVFYATPSGKKQTFQSLRSSGDICVNSNGYIYTNTTITDCKIYGAFIESSDRALYAEGGQDSDTTILSLSFSDCVIEGYSGGYITTKINNGHAVFAYSTSFNNTYFENVDNTPFIDLSGGSYYVTFSNCNFEENSAGQTNPPISYSDDISYISATFLNCQTISDYYIAGNKRFDNSLISIGCDKPITKNSDEGIYVDSSIVHTHTHITTNGSILLSRSPILHNTLIVAFETGNPSNNGLFIISSDSATSVSAGTLLTKNIAVNGANIYGTVAFVTNNVTAIEIDL